MLSTKTSRAARCNLPPNLRPSLTLSDLLWPSPTPSLPLSHLQTKLAVKDRTALTVTADETRAIAPPDLQPALDALAAAYPNGRCFVRPSYACCGSNPRLLSPPVRC